MYCYNSHNSKLYSRRNAFGMSSHFLCVLQCFDMIRTVNYICKNWKRPNPQKYSGSFWFLKQIWKPPSQIILQRKCVRKWKNELFANKIICYFLLLKPPKSAEVLCRLHKRLKRFSKICWAFVAAKRFVISSVNFQLDGWQISKHKITNATIQLSSLESTPLFHFFSFVKPTPGWTRRRRPSPARSSTRPTRPRRPQPPPWTTSATTTTTFHLRESVSTMTRPPATLRMWVLSVFATYASDAERWRKSVSLFLEILPIPAAITKACFAQIGYYFGKNATWQQQLRMQGCHVGVKSTNNLALGGGCILLMQSRTRGTPDWQQKILVVVFIAMAVAACELTG